MTVTVRTPHNGADTGRISQAVNYYLSQGLTPLGASYLVGNMVQESTMRTEAISYDGRGSRGLIQWTDDRLVGMPADFQGQLEFVFTDMDRDFGGRGLRALLSNPNASAEEVRAGIQRWIRWGELGNRWQYGEAILAEITGQPIPPVSPTAGSTPSLPGDYSQGAVGGTNSAVSSAIFGGENCPPPPYNQRDRIIYTGCQSKITSAVQAGGLGYGYGAPGMGAVGAAPGTVGAVPPYSGQLRPGAFINPTPTAVVTSEYGPRNGRFHAGIDLGAPTGTPIYASANGSVSTFPGHAIAGNFTIITHDDGSKTRYLHQVRFAVTTGQVSQGTVIGFVGSTGRSTGPHLHFEYIPAGGSAVDPRTIINF